MQDLKEELVGTICCDSLCVWKIIRVENEDVIVRDIIKRNEVKTNLTFVKNMLEKHSFNQILGRCCYLLSKTHPFVIVDLEGNLAASKISVVEYNLTLKNLKDQKVDSSEIQKFYDDNIFLIASSDVDNVTDETRDVLRLPEVYKELFYSLLLHIKSDFFTLNHISIILDTLDNNPMYDEYTGVKPREMEIKSEEEYKKTKKAVLKYEENKK